MSQITRKAQVVIATPDPYLLLLQTNQERGSYWQNCTGKIEDDEDFIAGATREAMEETGLAEDNIIDAQDIDLQHDFTDRWHRQVVERAILILVKEKWDIIIDPSEHQNFKWLAIDDLSFESVKYPGNFEALKKASLMLKEKA